MVLYGLVTGNDAVIDPCVVALPHLQPIGNIGTILTDTRRGPEARSFRRGIQNYTSIIWGDGGAFSTWFSGAFTHIGDSRVAIKPAGHAHGTLC